MDNKNVNLYKTTLILGILVVLAFGTGFYTDSYFKSSGSGSVVFVSNSDQSQVISTSTIDMAPFWKVWQILGDRFVPTIKASKRIDDQEKLWGAIQGLTSAYGDPYTVFMPPEDSKNFTSDIAGNFEGVGMEIGIKNDILTVVSPLKGTPAYNAGVKSGDQILSINGTSTEGMSVDSAVKLIRGPANTAVIIKVLREGRADPFEISITRGVINVPTIDTDTKGDVFIIKLYNFYAPSADAFKGALREFVKSGKGKLVLDLRGNPGGYLEAAVDMASWFLPMGKVVVRESTGNKTDEIVYRSKGYDVFSGGLKMAVLADGGSASASEILAGALQEQGVAKLVGTKTFGKGSVQELLPITPDTSLKVTIARWLTPKGNSISEGGLTPDYEVKITEKDVKDGKDPQLDKALEILK
jgi:carboxyl-terminal processing protease